MKKTIVFIFALLIAVGVEAQVSRVLYLPINGNVSDVIDNRTIISNGYSYIEDRNGIDSGAVSFDGSTQYFDVDSFGKYIPTEEISVSFWVKADKVKSHNLCMLMPNNSSNRMAISVYYNHNGQKWHFWDFKNTSSSRLGMQNIDFDSAWHFFVFTSSKADSKMKVYLDGELFASKVATNQLSASNSTLRIGGGVDANFDGSIDEFSVFQGVLDSAQVKELFDGTFASVSEIVKYDFDLFPNPSNGAINIKLPENLNPLKTTIKIVSLQGELLYTASCQSKNEILQTADFCGPGTYFIQLVDEEGGVKGAKRFIKS